MVLENKYESVLVKSPFYKEQLDEYDALALEIDILGEIQGESKKIGYANLLIHDEESTEFEIKEGYNDRRSEALKSIRYVNMEDVTYFKSYHPKTVTINEGRIAYLDKISINENYRGNGIGKEAITDIFVYLRKYLLVDFVLLFPYPFEWDEVEKTSENEIQIKRDKKRVELFYKKLGFEETYGILDEPYYYKDITDAADILY